MYRNFLILTSEVIDDFTDIMFDLTPIDSHAGCNWQWQALAFIPLLMYHQNIDIIYTQVLQEENIFPLTPRKTFPVNTLCLCMIETSLDLPWRSSAIFRNLRLFSNGNLWKSLKNVWKPSSVINIVIRMFIQ